MGFDVVVQSFRNGDASEADARLVMDLIASSIVQRDDEFGFAQLQFHDGQADLYGLNDLAGGFTVTNVTSAAAWDLIVEVACRAGLAILPPGCPTMVCRADLVAELPERLRDDAIVVTSGEQVLKVFRAC